MFHYLGKGGYVWFICQQDYGKNHWPDFNETWKGETWEEPVTIRSRSESRGRYTYYFPLMVTALAEVCAHPVPL